MYIIEESKKFPLVSETDVLVCGGGPAGVAAALTAARNGSSVQILEAGGCLGGIWTSGMMSLILDVEDKGAVLYEIMTELKRRGARGPYRNIYNPEAVKLLLEEMCLSCGVKLRYHTRLSAAVNEGGRLTTGISESKSGREAWKAKVFIDCTGDGDLAALAGCSYSLGRDENQETQPMSMIGFLGGVNSREIMPFIRGIEGGDGELAKKNFRELLTGLGVKPSYGQPTLFQVNEGLYIIMSNHEYNVSGINADDVTRATISGRAEINRQVDALRKHGAPWEAIQLLGTSAYIGVREGRRVHGRYTVTKSDLHKGQRHEDGICRTYFGADVHSTNPKNGSGYDNEGVKVLPYDIPLRALIAKDTDGLIMAGRCISGDFFAHSSYRVTGNSVRIGEAVGICAALASKNTCLPHEVPASEVKKLLSPEG